MKRILSVVLTLCIILPTLVLAVPAFAAQNNSGDPSSVADKNKTALSGGYISLDGVHLLYDNQLKSNDDGTYSLTVSVSASRALEQINSDPHIAKNGFYVVPGDGDYLIELWGAKGGDGADTPYGSGGDGGKGGYVYGVVTLKEGDIIYYSLGGNGQESPAYGRGGGVNGPGGTHGDSGGTTVGGGGGYSALYLFDVSSSEAQTFEEKYTSGGKLSVENIEESDRVSQYIMIAGGGGGGGSGEGVTLLGSSGKGAAHGGIGGSIGSTSGVLSGSEYDVEGTFFSGSDGKSSGSSTQYIGKGGSNVPGNAPKSMLSLFDGTLPNDWKGTYNTAYGGGAGGAGNLSGGGGGAGFCGGSGGVMAGLMTAGNIGGGGGGSSFVANCFRYSGLSAEEQSHLIGENPSTTGGAFAITPMGIDDLSYLDGGLTFSGTNTKYFYMKNITAKLGGVDSGIITANGDASLILVEGASVGMPVSAGEPGEPLIIDMLICPRRITGFAGGNGVPLIEGDSIFCVAQTVETVDNGDGNTTRNVLEEHGNGMINFGEDCGYVNVPYNLPVKTVSHMTNDVGHSHPISSLYEDNYADIRGDLASDWRYDYIESLGEYRVTDIYGGALEGDSVAPIVTTQYRVFFEVVPKDTFIAKVGVPVKATQIADLATVTIIGSSSGWLHDNQVTYTKDLVYDEESGDYVFSLNVKSNSTGEIEMMPEDLVGDSSLAQIATYEIKYDGYYLIRAWGANGGEGGDSGWNSQGGAGGKGGFIGGYLFLEGGTKLNVVNGLNGEPGTNGSGFLSWGGGGKGGQASYVYITNAGGQTEYLAIAGGGGGGGGYYLGAGAGGDSTEVTTTVPTSLDDFNGKDGGSRFLDQNSGGAGGKNYLRADIFTDTDVGASLPTDTGRHNLEEALKTEHTNDGGGAVYVHCLEVTETHSSAGEAEMAEMQNYDFELFLSRYFKAVEIWGENADGTAFTFTDNSETAYTENQGNVIKFHDIVPSIKQASPSEGSYVLSVDYTLYIRFEPREGFLGGNDVPLTEYDSGDFLLGMFLAQKIDVTVNGDTETKEGKLQIKEHNATDYVNVEVVFPTDDSALTVYEKDFIVGYSEPIAKNDLFTIKEGTIPTLPTDWTADFVKVVDPTSDEMLSPNVTTEYVIKLGVGPRSEAQRADVVPSVEGALTKKTATVHVDYRVDYHLTGINIPSAHLPTIDNEGEENDIYAIEYNADYEYALEAADGYYLPDTITVAVGGHTLVDEHDYTYDPATGKIFIDWDIINARLTITAVGRTQKHKLNFVWEETPGGEAHTQVFEYESGSEIDTTFADEKLASMAAVTGHTFRWDWGDGAEEAPDVMPAQDLWVTGFYAPNKYTLTVNYYLEGSTTELAPSHIAEFFYGQNYMIESPAITGHIADNAVISGYMDAEGKTVNVYYTKVEGSLNIVYLHTDTGHTEQTESVDLEAGQTVTVTPPPTEGHAPEYIKLVATMDDLGNISVKLYTTESEYTTVSGSAGMTLRVYYKHNTYKVSFDANGGNVSESERIVYFHHLYTYNGSSYDPLPTPIRVGYEFVGWYLDGSTLITDETNVETAHDHTLVAKWKGTEFNITVEYQYTDGSEAMPSVSYDLEYGTSYDIITPELRGHTPTHSSVSGTVSAQNSIIVVIFNVNSYTVTVVYLYSEDGSAAAETYSASYEHGASYSIASPTIDGMIASVETVSGTVDAANVSVTVYYDEEEPIISVSITWGEMNFDFERGEWQPDEHKYTDDTFTPVSDGANSVTVTNEDSSNVSVDVSLSFAPAEALHEADAYFTEVNDAAGEAITLTNVPKGEEKTLYVWMKGRLPNDATGNYICGTVTVIIRGGQK